MRLSPQAQSTIEYTSIIMLVVAGILLTGPYVIRSINAHFKSIDDQVRDTYEERIVQTSEDIFDLPECDCTDWLPGACRDGSAAGCGADLFRRYYRDCWPLGCENSFPVGIVEKCEYDPGCCTPWVDGECGWAGGLNDAGNPCPDDDRSQSRDCTGPGGPGDITLRRQCVTDASCANKCAPPKPLNTLFCPGAQVGIPVASMPYTIVKPPNTCRDFNASGTWNKPQGVTRVSIQLWGAGGGGGGKHTDNALTNQGGGGGGGGSYFTTVRTTGWWADTFYVEIGAGGAPFSGDGGTTNFRNGGNIGSPILYSAPGGRHGETTTDGSGAGAGGLGGIAASGSGQTGTAAAGGFGGKGGDSAGVGAGIGLGGPDGDATNVPPQLPYIGYDGQRPGGGGGGGGENPALGPVGTNTNTGGRGGPGFATICSGAGGTGCTGAKCEVYCTNPTMTPHPDGSRCDNPFLAGFNLAPITANCRVDRSNATSATMCTGFPSISSVTISGGARCTPPSGDPPASCVAALWP